MSGLKAIHCKSLIVRLKLPLKKKRETLLWIAELAELQPVLSEAYTANDGLA